MKSRLFCLFLFLLASRTAFCQEETAITPGLSARLDATERSTDLESLVENFDEANAFIGHTAPDDKTKQEWHKQADLRAGRSAKTLLLQGDVIESASDKQIKFLWNLGNGLMSAQEMQAASLLLKARGAPEGLQKEIEAHKYGAFCRDLRNLRGKGMDRERAECELVCEFFDAKDLGDLPLWHLHHCYSELRPEYAGLKNDGERRVERTWSGVITAPRSGEYTFSVSSLNPNCEGPWNQHQTYSVKVWIDGRLIVNASPQAWEPEGTPITLRSDQSANLRIETVLEWDRPHRTEVHDQLFWKGPGISTSIVPASAYQQPSGGGPGVLLEVKGQGGKEAYEHQCVVGLIDCPSDPTHGTAPDAALGERLLDEIANKWCRSVEAYAQAVKEGSEERPSHPITTWSWQEITNLATSRRLECLELALQTPELLDSDVMSLHFFYRSLRPGIEDEALDLFAAWMERNTDQGSQLAGSLDEFHVLNRMPLRTVTESLVWEHPEAAAQFEDVCLAGSDGGCSLPAATVLAYCYLIQGKILDWIDLLEAKLADDTLTGDRRVNWLLARAVAEEIRYCPADRHFSSPERLDAGMGWIDEAALVAESQEANRRVALERVARLSALRAFDQAEQSLDRIADTKTERQAIERFRQQAVEAAKQEQVAAQQAYVDELKRRQAAASQRGDTAGAERIAQRLERLEEQGEPELPPELPGELE